jgi:ParB-like chromosome segregation protein Spo0J
VKTESIAIDKLTLFPHQVRKHGKNQIAELKKSLELFKQTRPLVIDESNVILVGNGLWLAAKELGYEKLDCLRMTGMSDAMKKRLVLADNKTYSLGMDDYEEIEALIREVYAEDNAIDIPGFDNENMKMLVIGATEAAQRMEQYGKIPQEQQDKFIAPDSAEAPITPTMTDKQHRAYVLCPDCGRIIYLEGNVKEE